MTKNGGWCTPKIFQNSWALTGQKKLTSVSFSEIWAKKVLRTDTKKYQKLKKMPVRTKNWQYLFKKVLRTDTKNWKKNRLSVFPKFRRKRYSELTKKYQKLKKIACQFFRNLAEKDTLHWQKNAKMSWQLTKLLVNPPPILAPFFY